MRRIVMTIATAALALGVLAGPVDARPAGAGDRGKPAGVQCQNNGLATLQGAGVMADAARGTLDYFPFIASGAIDLGPLAAYLGLSVGDLVNAVLTEDGKVFLPLSLVLETHRNVPAAYPVWCDGLF